VNNSLNIIVSSEPYILPLIFLLISSIYFRFLLQIFGQSWVKTIAHTATLTLLPILTFIITNLISGNIALSLGMVGALSIVRFRNPVRSPLELSVYFGAITMGIAAAVNVKWLIFMVASLTLVSIVLFVLNLLSTRILGSPFFITSFSEGNSLSTLKIVSSKPQQKINDSKFLISKSVTNEEIIYVLASPNFDTLKNIEKDLIEFDGVSSTQLNQ
tara:strand:- start:9 stop:653 length:645 start_codon:yes stop_codon:yes gene_type:complete